MAVGDLTYILKVDDPGVQNYFHFLQFLAKNTDNSDNMFLVFETFDDLEEFFSESP